MICRYCSVELDSNNTKPSSRKYYRHVCRKCDNTNKNTYRAAIKFEVFEHYGKVCACCGEDKIEFLAIDHINGGGTKHRKEVGSGIHLYQWLRRNNYPEGFRVLCHNCNQALGTYGYCPHNEGQSDVATESILKIDELNKP